MAKYKCDSISRKLIFINERIAFCCGYKGKGVHSPQFPYLNTSVATIENFFEKRKIIEQELNGEREFSLCKSCIGCKELVEVSEDVIVKLSSEISHINLSFSPFYCQCRCIYCGYVDNPAVNSLEKAKQSKTISQVSEIIEYLRANKLLTPDKCTVNCGCGEITVHPKKDQILSSISDCCVSFYTNAFLYDEKIATNLQKNSRSSIHINTDAGTAKTYKTVKGFDLFYKVLDNLRKYNSIREGRIVFDYIIIPGINDSLEDMRGFTTICKLLNPKAVYLTNNTNLPITDELLASTVLFMEVMKSADINAHQHIHDISSKSLQRLKEFETLYRIDGRILAYRRGEN